VPTTAAGSHHAIGSATSCNESSVFTTCCCPVIQAVCSMSVHERLQLLVVCCKAASGHTCLPVTKRHDFCCNVLLQAAEYKQT